MADPRFPEYPESKIDPGVADSAIAHKLSAALNKKIPLVESFGPTIQGEGIQIGVQTYFMRFGLCDYKCIMCDSMHAVDPKQVKANATWLTQEQIFDNFVSTGVYKGINSAGWMTFTGGNPCMHNLDYLVSLLHGIKLRINVETQGTLAPEWLQSADLITCSPKGPGMGEVTDVRVLDKFLATCWQYNKPVCMKIVIFDQRDLDFAVEMHEQFKDFPCSWFLSLGNTYPPGYHPEYHPATHAEAMDNALIRYRMLFEDIQNHPVLSKMRFLPQWHWFVWGDEKGR